MLSVRIKQPPDHSLILRVVPLRLGLEKLDASPAQSDGDLHPIVLKHKVLRAGKKVRYDLWVSQGFVCVLYFCAHRFVYLSANSLRQRCE